MGARGPRPKPTRMKVIEGTFRPDRAPKNEPKPPAKIPTAPKWLGPDAKAEWRRVTKQLAPLEMLTELDRTTLALYCQALQDYLDAQRDLEREYQFMMERLQEAKDVVMLSNIGRGQSADEAEPLAQPMSKLTAVTPKGATIIHPLVSIRNEAWKRVLKAAAEFGMTPSSRSRIDLPAGPQSSAEQDPWAALKSGVRRRA